MMSCSLDVYFYYSKALELVEKGCDILIARKECPAEIVVGFYYLRGTIYERTQQRYHAIRVYTTALNILETVYGKPFSPSRQIVT